MPTNRSSRAKRASASDPNVLHAETQAARRGNSRAVDPPVTPIKSTDDAAVRPEQRKAIAQTTAHENPRLASSPGAVGTIGRTLLLIAALSLAGLMAVWLLLAV